MKRREFTLAAAVAALPGLLSAPAHAQQGKGYAELAQRAPVDTKPGEIEVIAGINLPMLIRLDSARKHMDVKAAVTAAAAASTSGPSSTAAAAYTMSTARPP